MATRKKTAEAAPEEVSETPVVETSVEPKQKQKAVPHGAIELHHGILLYKSHGVKQ